MPKASARPSTGRKPASAAPLYAVHPSIQMMVDWVASLKAKTGRSLDEWVRFIRKEGPASEEARRDWLKKEHAVGTNTASWLAERSVGKSGEEDTPEGYLAAAPKYVDAMYAARPALRPLHDRLIDLARSIAGDVKVCPCQTIVPLYRNHVFAQVKPSTKTRIDFGLALGAWLKQGRKIPDRLIDTGGLQKKDRITHRIPVLSPADIDADLERWLRTAYDLDA